MSCGKKIGFFRKIQETGFLRSEAILVYKLELIGKNCRNSTNWDLLVHFIREKVHFRQVLVPTGNNSLQDEKIAVT